MQDGRTWRRGWWRVLLKERTGTTCRMREGDSGGMKVPAGPLLCLRRVPSCDPITSSVLCEKERLALGCNPPDHAAALTQHPALCPLEEKQGVPLVLGGRS